MAPGSLRCGLMGRFTNHMHSKGKLEARAEHTRRQLKDSCLSSARVLMAYSRGPPWAPEDSRPGAWDSGNLPSLVSLGPNPGPIHTVLGSSVLATGQD